MALCNLVLIDDGDASHLMAQVGLVAGIASAKRFDLIETLSFSGRSAIIAAMVCRHVRALLCGSASAFVAETKFAVGNQLWDHPHDALMQKLICNTHLPDAVQLVMVRVDHVISDTTEKIGDFLKTKNTDNDDDELKVALEWWTAKEIETVGDMFVEQVVPLKLDDSACGRYSSLEACVAWNSACSNRVAIASRSEPRCEKQVKSFEHLPTSTAGSRAPPTYGQRVLCPMFLRFMK